MDHADNNRATRATIIAALHATYPDLDADAVADTVLRALAAPMPDPTSPAILAPHGRVLMELLVDPDASLQQVADRLGSTASTVAHAMTRLVGAGWGVRTRVGGRNHYDFDLERLLQHRDIAAVCRALAALTANHAPKESDSTRE